MPFTIDRGHDDPIYSPVCTYCVHLLSGMDRTCKAFPKGIPEVIWRGLNDHTRPYSGDQGIQFKRVEVAYSAEISFPIEPSKADIQELRQQITRDRFRVVDGGRPASLLRPHRTGSRRRGR